VVVVPIASQNSDQQKAMRSYADAVGKLYQKPVIPWYLAFALTSVLAGRDLSNDSLAPLTRAILGALDSAFVCKDVECDLRSSTEFRASVGEAYDSLLALGVNSSNASIAAEGLIQAGYQIRHRDPLIRPIHPATRPVSPTSAE
jgi:hypothetical protein